MRGVLVPLKAIVWWQGQAWVYKQATPGRFVRQEIETGTHAEGGLFVSEGISQGTKWLLAAPKCCSRRNWARKGRQAERKTPIDHRG